MTDTENDTESNQVAGESPDGPRFAIKRIFVRDISFEMPGGMETFSLSGQPKVAQDLNTEIQRVDEQHYAVTLKMTITVKLEDDKVAYLVEVHQTGIFMVTGVEGEQLKHVLAVQCPGILFPYVREAIDGVVVKGGFPPLALPPINFDAIVAQATAEADGRSAFDTAEGTA